MSFNWVQNIAGCIIGMGWSFIDKGIVASQLATDTFCVGNIGANSPARQVGNNGLL